MVIFGPYQCISIWSIAQHQCDMHVGIISKVVNDVLAIGTTTRNKDGNVGHRFCICVIVVVVECCIEYQRALYYPH